MTDVRLRKGARGGKALVALAVMIAGLVVAAPASAATFTPTKTTDSSDGTCDAADCSLREAINAANGDTTQDTVAVPAGTYTLTLTGPEDDAFFNNPTVGDLDILNDTLVQGAGARTTTVTAGPGFDDRIFDIPPLITGFDPPEVAPSEANVEISGLTVTRGDAPIGGGIRNVGTLTLRDSTVTRNSVTLGGGAIRNDFHLTVERSTLSRNTSTESGPGLGGGGGLFNNDQAALLNSTISLNSSGTFGGGITNFGAAAQVTSTNVTVNRNSAPVGANIANGEPPSDSPETAGAPSTGGVRLRSTIVANPQGGGQNCSGTITPAGFNLEFPGTSCAAENRGDPLLAPLANNGGQTDTHALRAGSPAIDRVGAGACPPPATDQTGTARPQGVRCDIGAFERILSADLRLRKTASPSDPKVGDDLTFTLTVTNRGPDTARNVQIIDQLPDGVTFKSASPSCTRSGRTVTCDAGDLEAGASATRRIVVRVDRPGRIENNATARSDTPDQDPDNGASAGVDARCSITGTAGNDVIRGTPGDDFICAGDGNDVVYGLGGNDTLIGGRGNDVLRGGDGDDRLEGGEGDDQLVGGDGDDRLTGAGGGDDLTGQDGDDSLDARDGVSGNDVANGGPGSDSCSTDDRDVRTSC